MHSKRAHILRPCTASTTTWATTEKHHRYFILNIRIQGHTHEAYLTYKKAQRDTHAAYFEIWTPGLGPCECYHTAITLQRTHAFAFSALGLGRSSTYSASNARRGSNRHKVTRILETLVDDEGFEERIRVGVRLDGVVKPHNDGVVLGADVFRQRFDRSRSVHLGETGVQPDKQFSNPVDALPIHQPTMKCSIRCAPRQAVLTAKNAHLAPLLYVSIAQQRTTF